jgi:hypothetical protein
VQKLFSTARWTTQAIGAAATAILVCACSAGPHQSPGASITPPALDGARPPATLAAAESALPLASYTPPPEQGQSIVRALGILQAECMKQRGYRGFTPTPVLRFAATPPGGGGPFGYVNADYAAQRGFHPPKRPHEAHELTLTEVRAASACAAQAARNLDPSPRNGGNLLVSLSVKSQQDAVADARVRAATREWAACMKAAGFGADNPESLVQEPWLTPPSAREIATAKADAACTKSADLAGIYFAALAGYQRELATPYAKALTAIKKQGQSEVAMAAQIVAATE